MLAAFICNNGMNTKGYIMNKSQIITTLFLSLSLFSFNSQAEQTPKSKPDVPQPSLHNDATKSATELMIYEQKIANVQLTIGDTAATIFLNTNGSWTVYNAGSECPTPSYAMLQSDKAGAQELLSIALLAKTQNHPVTIHGVCGYHPNYFEITRIVL